MAHGLNSQLVTSINSFVVFINMDRQQQQWRTDLANCIYKWILKTK